MNIHTSGHPLAQKLERLLAALPAFQKGAKLEPMLPALQEIEAAYKAARVGHYKWSKDGKRVPDRMMFSIYDSKAWKNYRAWLRQTPQYKAEKRESNARYASMPKGKHVNNRGRRRLRHARRLEEKESKLLWQLVDELPWEDTVEEYAWGVLDELDSLYFPATDQAEAHYWRMTLDVLRMRMREGWKQSALLKHALRRLYPDSDRYKLEMTGIMQEFEDDQDIRM